MNKPYTDLLERVLSDPQTWSLFGINLLELIERAKLEK